MIQRLAPTRRNLANKIQHDYENSQHISEHATNQQVYGYLQVYSEISEIRKPDDTQRLCPQELRAASIRTSEMEE